MSPLERAMRLRDEAFQRWQRHDTTENWQAYNDRDQQVKRLIEDERGKP